MGKGFFRKKRSFRKKKDSSIYEDIGGEDGFEHGEDIDGNIHGHYNTNGNLNINIQPRVPLTHSTNTNTNTNNVFISRDIGNNDRDSSHNSNSDELSVASQDVCLEELDCLVNDLANCGEETFGEKPARALRILFALSEHHDLHEINRIRMVREANGKLVPTLMQFLQICEPASSEQYLALLVLNNVSIPSENKRIVSIDHKGAHVLSRMLCWYPSCSLICIILVNLTFCEQSLRKQLVEEGSSIQLVEAFAYALKVSISPEGTTPPEIVTKDSSPRQLLARLEKSEDNQTTPNPMRISSPFNPNNIAYPETARWALCGMKNLTRPSRDPIAAHALVQSGVLQMILRVLTIGSGSQRQASNDYHLFQSSEYKGINMKEDVYLNDPYTWDSASMQDAALYVLMNLAITPGTRPHVKNEMVARMVALVARYSASPLNLTSRNDEEQQKDLQCLKARMTLAYIFGSEGNFGQVPSSGMTVVDRSEDLKIKGSEAPLLVELLSNTLHGRGKKGAGGYNASTFNAKKVLFAIRCLLTNFLNVKTFFVTCGVKLNILLLKTLALHSIQEVAHVDMEAAEDAVWSLYLLSNYGFMGPFLPSPQDGYPFKQILFCYLRKATCTAAGRHAARQLLLRHPYLNMDGNILDDEPLNLIESDLDLGHALLHAAESLSVPIEDECVGGKPLDDIFGRPLMRRLVSNGNGKTKLTPWESSRSALSAFNSALDAVREFSFKLGADESETSLLDDIQIANNIANNANGYSNDCYGYEWSWQDGGTISETDVRQKLNDFRSGKIEKLQGLLRNVRTREKAEPITLFGINCGCNSVLVD